jgi:hypothetical protein
MIGPTVDIPCYTEEAQLGYQGYFVYQTAYNEGLGIKVARCSAGTETELGVIVRGGEYASSGVPQSVVVRIFGPAVVIAGATDMELGERIGAEAGGQGAAKTANKDHYMGICTKRADSDKAGEVLLTGHHSLSA